MKFLYSFNDGFRLTEDLLVRAFYSCFTIVNQFLECTSICLNDLFLEKFQVDQFNVCASSSSILCKFHISRAIVDITLKKIESY